MRESARCLITLRISSDKWRRQATLKDFIFGGAPRVTDDLQGENISSNLH